MDPASPGLQQSRPSGDFPPRHAPARWLRGQFVRVRGERWRIESARRFADCELLRLTGVGGTNAGRAIGLLTPFDTPRRLDAGGRLRRISWHAWMRVFARLAATATPCGRLRTAARAAIDLHAYQFEPALAVLGGQATRVLLADEVGLGKTIQAGLIVAELQARDPAMRTLILTPAGLRDQWACELRERFSIEATVMDASMVLKTIGQIAPGTNPWSVWPVVIASFDFVKRPEVLNALTPFTWDALVVDEAHQCASAPERSTAITALASRARHVILLTATPHGGDEAAFAALCDIGRLSSDEPVVMFRRSRADVGLPRARRVHLLRVRCTEVERRMHQLLARYTHAVWTSGVARGDARLAMIVLRKRALSSAHSLARSLERRLDALFEAAPGLMQLALPFAGTAAADEQTAEDDEPMECLAASGLDPGRERRWLIRLIDAAHDATREESKLRRLQALLARAREPAIVFTEYRDTARWLASSLSRTVVLHGGLSRGEREDVERRFRAGNADVLVATDAAGEGLNLHHRCRLVINLELPWNPVRLEQRIGRVDRLGQARRPHAIHLVGRGTSEQRIVERLVLRQERARLALGTVNDAVGTAGEEEVGRAVIEDHLPVSSAFAGSASTAAPAGCRRNFATIDLRSPAAEEADRLKLARTLVACRSHEESTKRHRPDAGDAIGGVVAHLPRRRSPQGLLSSALVCVFTFRTAAYDDEVIDEQVVPVRVQALHSKVLARSDLEALNRNVRLREVITSAIAGRLDAAKLVHARFVASALGRERELERGIGQDAEAVQQGMFDDRAMRQAEHERQQRRQRAAQHGERIARLAVTSSRPPTVRADLALVLRMDGGRR